MTRVLIVEDDPAQARALARLLSRRRPDLTVLTSANGAEAVRLMTECGVDLILTDLTMPELDGFELLAWAANHCPEVPVFAMSAFGSDETTPRVTALGAVDYFTKPIDERAVVARITDELSQTVRGHVQNVSLASFLQLLEMERKTCTLTVTCGDQSGLLTIRKGVLTDAESAKLTGEPAATKIIAWPNPSIAISSQVAASARTIDRPLGFIIMEAMRVQDENARSTPGSEWPTFGHSVRPGSVPAESLRAATTRSQAANGELGLPSGVRALAVVDSATGALLHSAAVAGFPVLELASMAAFALRQQATTFALCNQTEGVEELVLSTTTRCDLIRPLDAGATRFALLVFAPEETNLVMARLELERFVFTHGGVARHVLSSTSQRTP